MRRKPFPYYDEFTIIWGKDRATGEGAETPADACDEIEREEVEGFVDGGDLNGISVSASTHTGASTHFTHVKASTHVEASTHVGASMGGANVNVIGDSTKNGGTDPDVVASDVTTKNKKRGKAQLTQEVIENMAQLTDMFRDTNDNIAMLARCFKHESDAADMQQKVMKEIMQLEDLTVSQKAKAAEVIISNPNKMVVFFNLDPQNRAEYVTDQLYP